jgi:hypothetical protein
MRVRLQPTNLNAFVDCWVHRPDPLGDHSQRCVSLNIWVSWTDGHGYDHLDPIFYGTLPPTPWLADRGEVWDVLGGAHVGFQARVGVEMSPIEPGWVLDPEDFEEAC